MLVTEAQDVNVEELLALARAHGFTELMVPKTVVRVEALPVLGSGKLDYVALDRLARGEG
ncbi:hypothetical protein [Methylobrevis pamukkalensis]|uniref:hypothetical protein n=1 Tax=Methylobrevis pamukkalensis TaxID=1439726 RepID=UPI001AECC43F|nr:hypothetical protein [Methylobrevis pamukkalensis]